jgi:hypothetical protein
LLGFAIVDRQPTANSTAVWLTTRLEGSQVRHTNAVVVLHDDERHDAKVWALTADRAVVLTDGSTPPIAFRHSLSIDVFGKLINETAATQQRIVDAITDHAARTKIRTLVVPEFSKPPVHKLDDRDEPQYRALSAADYVAAVWSAWLSTDEQRARRTTEPRTGQRPWIMPDEMGSPTVAEFPPEFALLVNPEPVVKPAWVS